jgi:hypothetical protein
LKNNLNRVLANLKYDITTDDEGTIFYRVNGQLHREDGPAVIHPDGGKEWWLNGERHRSRGPAIIYSDGSQEWYRNDQLHRLNGPAIKCADNGAQIYYRNGVLIKIMFKVGDQEEGVGIL